MIKEKIKKGLARANKCKDYVQTTSIAIVLALIIVAKSQRKRHEFKKDTIK
tara:strand:- start:387 stop:539 length:153 start_codon:yes stop_codon:yes gene_type:complete